MSKKNAVKVSKSVDGNAPKSTGGADNGYPFQTKTQLKNRIATDPAFVVTCLNAMVARQSVAEQSRGLTTDRNKVGLMVSHAANATRLAKEAEENGGVLSGPSLDQARTIVSRYAKQLASHFRGEAIASDPELAKTASMFGVK